jgi:hypothetical protein
MLVNAGDGDYGAMLLQEVTNTVLWGSHHAFIITLALSLLKH